MTYKISVIVPVYNTAAFLRKCLDSLVNQTFQDLEIILIDDGSTDNSGLICDEYADIYGNIKVIHQSNQGSAKARQVGLDIAIGKYLIICDSDDWVEQNIYEKLYNEAEKNNSDIVICDFYSNYNNGNEVPYSFNYKSLKSQDIIIKCLNNNRSYSSWNKLIKRSIINDNGIYYEPGINLGEDALFLMKLLLCKPSVSYVQEPLYHYRRRKGEDTYTNNITLKKAQDYLWVHKWKVDNLYDDIFKSGIRQSAIDLNFTLLRCGELSYQLTRKTAKTILPINSILTFPISAKALFILISRLFGVKLSRYILRFTYKYIYK